MPFASPRFVVLRHRKGNLGVSDENGKSDGKLICPVAKAVNPNAKFEVEMSKSGGTDDLVHIRSCHNNKYWVSNRQYINATANKKEEDQSSELCTLFKLHNNAYGGNTVQIRHVQSGKYLWIEQVALDMSGVVVEYGDSYSYRDREYLSLFAVNDWESLVILPRYVAFKGDNDQYLRLLEVSDTNPFSTEVHPYLQFSSDYIGDPSVGMEIFTDHDGNIHIKSTCNDNFWRYGLNRIRVDSVNPSYSFTKKDTVFRPFKIDDQTIALRNLAYNTFCKRLSKKAKTNYLTAGAYSVTKEVKLRVEELVLERKFFDIKYNLDNSRIYDESVLLLAKNSVSNYTQEEETLGVKLSYTDTKTGTWNNNFSLKLGKDFAMGFSLPHINLKGKIEVSTEIQSGVKWGETETRTQLLEVVNQVKVSPMTKVTMIMTAKSGKCDVPFTYSQQDSLYNGNIVLDEGLGGTYTGSSYYDINYETKEEPLSSGI